MRKAILECIIAFALLSSGSVAVSDDRQPADRSGKDSHKSGSMESDPLPGKITDPNIVLPPGDRTSYSGAPRDWKNVITDSRPYIFTLFDRLEYGDADDGTNNYLWDAQGWIGGDYNKFWWRTEGEGVAGGGRPESTEFQALYNRSISPFWGIQAGLRYDINPEPDTGYAVLGLQGLAPYWFETTAALFASEDGNLSFRGEFEYELLLSQRLILQPRLEFNASASDVSELGLGSGLNNTEAGLRLRYEIRREFAPYIGVRWEKLYGETKNIAQDAGESTSVVTLVLGFRMWY